MSNDTQKQDTPELLIEKNMTYRVICSNEQHINKTELVFSRPATYQASEHTVYVRSLIRSETGKSNSI